MRCDIKGINGFYEGMECGINDVDTTNRKNTNYVSDTNTELTDWQDNFVKGYLLGMSSSIKKYYVNFTMKNQAVYFTKNSSNFYNIYHVGKGSTTSSCYGYIQNNGTTLYGSNLKFIILNSKKEKINAIGEILPLDDISFFSGYPAITLPTGTYYYREIKAYDTELIKDDIEFKVLNGNTSITILHKPPLIKMEYSEGEITTEEIFPNTRDNLVDEPYSMTYWYDKKYPIKNEIDIPPILALKSVPNIGKITAGNIDYTNNFLIYFEDTLNYLNPQNSNWHINAVLYGIVDPDKQASYIKTNESGSTGRNAYYLYQKNTYYNSQVGIIDWSKGNMKLNMPKTKCLISGEIISDAHFGYSVYGILNNISVNTDIIYHEIVNIDKGYHMPVHGWRESETHIYGNSYNDKVIEYHWEKYKNTHSVAIATKLESSTASKVIKNNSYYWDETPDSYEETIQEGEITVKDVTKRIYYPPTANLFKYFDSIYINIMWDLEEKGLCLPYSISNGAKAFYYYETEDGIVEADFTSGTRYSITDNPTVADEDIVKSYIAAPIFFDQIKEGYEHYFS